MNEKKDIGTLAKEAYTSIINEYCTILVLTFVITFLAFALCFDVVERKFSILTGIIFVLVVMIALYVLVRFTLLFFKARKSYRTQEYTYHHVEVKRLRGCRTGGLFAEFWFNNEEHSEFVTNHRVKYVHVFNFDGKIGSIADYENLLK